MAFTIPAIDAIGSRIRTAFRAYLPGTDAWIEPNNLSITGKAFALTLFDAYQRIKYLNRQLFASTADADHLEKRHAAEYGLTRKASSPATGFVLIPRVGGDDIELPIGLQLQRDDGIVFAATAATTASNAMFVVPVKCITTGAATNTIPGTALAILGQTGITLDADAGTVDEAGLGAGADPETDEELRARVLQRKRFTPMAGAISDYVRWALEVPGVTRAYASGFSNLPPGVVVYPLFDGTRPQGIPTIVDLAAVSAHVDSVRPVTARVFHVAAKPQQVNVRIGTLDIDTSGNRGAIATQLGKLFAERAAVSTVDAPLVFRRGWIEAAIDRALGGSGFTLISPLADIVVPAGALPFLGTIQYA